MTIPPNEGPESERAVRHWFSHTDSDSEVEFRALPVGGGKPVAMKTREPNRLAEFVKGNAEMCRGIYFATCTRTPGKGGAREHVLEAPGAWVDIDSEKIGTSKQDAVFALQSCQFPPSAIHDSGGGVHAFWKFTEAMDVRADTEKGRANGEMVEKINARLAAVFAGDAVCRDLARIMRLPGTLNTKYDPPRPCEIIEQTTVEYEPDDLADWLENQRPLLVAKAEEKSGAQSNAYEAHGGAQGGERLDVDAELDAMAKGDAPVNDTLLRASAALVSCGWTDDDIVERLIEAARPCEALDREQAKRQGRPWRAWVWRIADEKPGDRWQSEERTIRDMCDRARAKGFDTHEGPEAGPNPEAWDSPDLSLLHDARPPAPEYPLQVFPEPWAHWILQQAEACNAPPDFVGAALLSVAGALLGNARWIETTRSLRSPPILWTCCVGAPGSGKSPAQKAVLALLDTLEREYSDGYAHKLAEHRELEARAKIERKVWEADCTKAIKDGEAAPPMPEAATEPEKPTMPRLAVGDITPEELHAIAAGNSRGLLKVHDELAALFASFNRYADGGDREMYLERFDGAPFSVDRRTRDPLHIPRHTVGIIGGTQPDKMDSLLGNADDGMSGRICWQFPEPIPVADPVDHEPDQWAVNALRRLLSLHMAQDEHGAPVPVYVRFAPDAREAFMAGRRDALTEAREKHGFLATTMEKSPGLVARLALIFEFLAWCADPHEPEPKAVSLLSVGRAGEYFQDYLAPMAARVFGNFALPPGERLAALMLRHIRKNKIATFNAVVARRGKDAWHLPGMSDAALQGAALAVLEAGGIIRPKERTRKRGRPATDYEVNALAL